MKAIAVLENGKVEIVEVPVPKYEDYECLVKIKASGLCNSTDLKIISNEIGAMKVNYPVILGHEGAGEVVATGKKVKNFKVGDKVINPEGRINPHGPYTSMWGGMAEYGVVKDLKVMRELGMEARAENRYGAKKLPESISCEDAAVILSLKENYSALKNFGVKPGMDLLIYGDGPVGLGLVSFSRLFGASWVGCAGHRRDRLERAARIGQADLTIDTHHESVSEKTNGRQFDLIIDAVGKMDLVAASVKMLKPGGKIGMYGVIKPKDRMLDMLSLPDHICIHKLTFPYMEHAVHDEVVEMILDGRINPKDYYSHVMPMDRIEEAIKMITAREAFKVVLSMEGSTKEVASA